MNQIKKVFQYDGRQVRTVMVNGEPHFIAKDVCEILEISNPSDAIKRLDQDEYALVSIEGIPGGIPINAVTESGLYSLVLGSRKPEAKTFKRWITHEVLPSIRQTGQYSSKPMTQLEILVQASQALMEQERKLNAVASAQQEISQEFAAIKHRVSNLDLIDIDGTPQQRLNAMVKKYAHKTGVLFNVAWRDFINAYNTAYCTNLKLAITKHKDKHGLKELTVPQFLSMTGHLEDGIRVADKLINA